MKTLARPGDKAELLQRLEALRPEAQARWGRMSAHQVVCHMSDSFRMALREKSVSPKSGFPERTILKWIALYAPLPWPRGIQTRPEIDQQLGGTRPVEFATDVEQLRTLLESMTARAVDLDGHVHPIFGRMTDAAWLRWGYLHTSHHLRQFGC
jgi:hypothetical protein